MYAGAAGAHYPRLALAKCCRTPGYRPSLFDATTSVLTGYFANYIIPRMGEVTRCGTLYKLEKVPVNLSFGTVVAERVFDVLTLLVLIALNFPS